MKKTEKDRKGQDNMDVTPSEEDKEEEMNWNMDKGGDMSYDNGCGGWYDSWNDYAEVNFAGKGGMADGKGKGKRKGFKTIAATVADMGARRNIAKIKAKAAKAVA